VLHFVHGRPVLGFGLLCAAAGLSRIASWIWLRRFHEEPWHESPHLRFSFATFLRALPRSNFARFTVCLAAFNFGVHLAAPFFAVYMLQELGYGHLTYTTIVLAASVMGFLSSQGWGLVGDRTGNHAVVRWTVLGVSVLPILWPLSGHPAWMGLLNVLGAFLWGGLNLSAANFLYDAVSPPKRHIASTILRFAAAVAFRRFVREVRPVRQVGLREAVLDSFGQRMVQVLGFFSVRPEIEGPRRSHERK
jgi:hypothetical protein